MREVLAIHGDCSCWRIRAAEADAQSASWSLSSVVGECLNAVTKP